MGQTAAQDTSQFRGQNLSLFLLGIERRPLGRPDGGLVTGPSHSLISRSCPFYSVPEHGSCKDIPEDAGLLCDKATVLQRTIKETPCTVGLQYELLCSSECVCLIDDSRGADTIRTPVLRDANWQCKQNAFLSCTDTDHYTCGSPGAGFPFITGRVWVPRHWGANRTGLLVRVNDIVVFILTDWFLIL